MNHNDWATRYRWLVLLPVAMMVLIPATATTGQLRHLLPARAALCPRCRAMIMPLGGQPPEL